MIPKSVSDMLRDMDHPSVGIREKQAILSVLDIADQYGYGNVIAWLRTAWAVKLRDQGIPEKAAIEAALTDPYPLPK